MKTYKVFLNAFASATVEVDANSPEEAFKLALENADGYADTEFSEWDYERAEVEDPETGEYFDIGHGDSNDDG